MIEKETCFPSISGRMDLPANIYLHTLTYEEIEERKRLGYKLVIPIAQYKRKEYLSIGIEGFFLSRLMECVSERANVVVHYPIWIKDEDELYTKIDNMDLFGFTTFLLKESGKAFPLNGINVLTIEELFHEIIDDSYDKYRELFYISLSPEMTHIEKMKGLKTEKINFELYNKSIEIIGKVIEKLVGILG